MMKNDAEDEVILDDVKMIASYFRSEILSVGITSLFKKKQIKEEKYLKNRKKKFYTFECYYYFNFLPFGNT